jgi:colicin import membrane protein
MNTAAADDDRLAFAPPKQPGLLRGFALAVLAHGLLVAALMHGLQWKRDAQDAAVEAELWSALPQQAAPREVPPPPPPPEPVVKAPPAPVVKAPPEPDPQVQRDAQIALEREKQKRERELEKRELEKRKLVEQRAKLEAQKKKQREEELAKKKLEQQKLVAEAKRKEEEKRRKQEEQEAREAKVRDQIRQDAIKRNLAMAGTGNPSSTGGAAQSSGPSAGWAARVIGKVRPNIVFTEVVTGNLEAVVEVRLAPDGTIVGKRLKKASGNRSWDEAVLRALDKTEVLPRDPETGKVPSGADLVFRPRS